MGILILFVLAVGAGTIVYFVWKFVAGIFKADAIKQDMAAVTGGRTNGCGDEEEVGHPNVNWGKGVRSWGGELWFLGRRL